MIELVKPSWVALINRRPSKCVKGLFDKSLIFKFSSVDDYITKESRDSK